MGDPLDAATQMGPLVSRAHAARVAEHIADGRRAGAALLCGGETAGDNHSFITPTVLTGVRPDMRVVREEIFGPVLVATPFDDVDQVVAAAREVGLVAVDWVPSPVTGGDGNAEWLLRLHRPL